MSIKRQPWNKNMQVRPAAYNKKEKTLSKEMFMIPKTLGGIEPSAHEQAIAFDRFPDLWSHTLKECGFDVYPQFPGYAYLTGLSQNPIIQTIIEMYADEMTGRWITIERQGDEEDFDQDINIAEIEEEFERFKIQTHIRECVVNNNKFGGCLLYPDTGSSSLDKPKVWEEPFFVQGSLRKFKVIEPVLISPGWYDAFNPLSDDYYKPVNWFVQGINVHSSRVMHFSQKEVSILLKAPYNFFGMSTIQKVADGVAHFTGGRESVSRLLQKFAIILFKSNLTQALANGPWDDIQNRLQHFVNHRNNDGIELIDKDKEEVSSVNIPLSGTTDILNYMMIYISALAEIPQVKLWGVSPSGFNATGDADMRSFYDNIASEQKRTLKDHIDTILKVIQLNKYGKIDKTITFKFNPLSDEDELKVAQVQKIYSDIDAQNLDRGVVTPEEVREKLANDPNNGYDNLQILEKPKLTDREKAAIERLLGNG